MKKYLQCVNSSIESDVTLSNSSGYTKKVALEIKTERNKFGYSKLTLNDISIEKTPLLDTSSEYPEQKNQKLNCSIQKSFNGSDNTLDQEISSLIKDSSKASNFSNNHEAQDNRTVKNNRKKILKSNSTKKCDLKSYKEVEKTQMELSTMENISPPNKNHTLNQESTELGNTTSVKRSKINHKMKSNNKLTAVNSKNNKKKIHVKSKMIIDVNVDGINDNQNRKQKKISARLNNSQKKSKKQKKNQDDCESPKPTDAFQVMMDSRKKIIGTNSPGKIAKCSQDPQVVEIQREVKAKRKLCLEKWAEKKGAKGKKELEVNREEYVKKLLSKREKIFKNMLCKNNQDSPALKNPSLKKYKLTGKVSDISALQKKGRKRRRDASCDNHGNLLKKTKPINNSSNEKSESSSGKILRTSNDTPDDSFLKQLLPSIRKKESVLSYFEKVQDEDILHSSSEVPSDSQDSIKIKFKESSHLKKPLRKSNRQKKNLNISSNNCEQELNPTLDVDNKISNLQIKIIKTQKSIRKLSKNCLKSKEVLPIAADDLLEKQHTQENHIQLHLRPKRNIKKPIKYDLGVSGDSDNDSDTDKFQIFIKKKTMVIDNTSKEKTKLKINKENIKSVCKIARVKIISPLKIVNIGSPDMLCVRSPASSSSLSLAKKTKLIPVKLAPLFAKSFPKPLVDPSVAEARQKFLLSGMPDVIKKQNEKQSISHHDFCYFPSTCHVRQLPEKCGKFDVWNLPIINFKAEIEDDLFKPQDTSRDFQNHYKINTAIENINRSSLLLVNLKSFNHKEGLHEIKQKFPKFPVYRTFRQLNEKFLTSMKNHDSDVPPKTNIINLKPSKSSSDLIANVDEFSSLWTEKYKPMTSEDILGNCRSIKQIKIWLETWKEYSEITINKSKRIRRNSGSSSDFYSDSESRDSTRHPSNTIVMVGPHGSGKTTSLYAIANELNINILEVNASSKRTGKRILTELQEATQSHKVLTKMTSDSSSFSGFSNILDKPDSQEKCEKLKNYTHIENNFKLFKRQDRDMCSSQKCKKDKFSVNDYSNDGFSQKSNLEANKMSLMLIEDADIVFEEDDGFVAALNQIVQSSKRPVVIVASDVNCSHLQRFMKEQNVVKFNNLSGKLLGPWLDVLLLIECGRIIPSLASLLVDFHKGDMRKTILQLQYWILSNRNTLNQLKKEPGKLNTFTANELKDNESFSGNLLEEESNISWNSKCEQRLSSHSESKTTLLSSQSNAQEISPEDILKHMLFQEMSTKSDFSAIWCNMSNIYNGQCRKLNKCDTATNVQEYRQVNDTNSDLNSIVEFLDILSTVDILQTESGDTSDFMKLPWKASLKDSLSEMEDFTEFCSHKELISSCSSYLSEHSFMNLKIKLRNSDDSFFSSCVDVRDSRHSVNAGLCNAVSFGAQLDRSGLALDYLPTLRSICRLEKTRSGNNFKRNNRFYHYLRSIIVNSKDHIFEKACEILDCSSVTQ